MKEAMLEMVVTFYQELQNVCPEDLGAMQQCLQELAQALREDEQ